MSEDHERYREKLSGLRSAAVAEIIEAGGLPKLIEFLDGIPAAWSVGLATADLDNPPSLATIACYLDTKDQALVDFAFAFVRRSTRGELEPTLHLVETLDGRPLAQARVLASVDELPDAWSSAAQLGPEIDAWYWKEFRITGRGSNFAYVNEVAQQLIDHGRPAAALDLMCTYRDNLNDPLVPEIVVEAFDNLIQNGDADLPWLSSWEIEQLLEYLRESPLDQEVLALLEWNLLPAIGIKSSGWNLQRKLARDAGFFVEILSLCFRSDSPDEDNLEVPSHVAQNAFRLVMDWKHIPGSTELGGPIEGDQLRAWYEEARRQLIERGRLSVGESYFGRVLAASYVETDGAWPAVPVRDLVEWASSTEVENGLITGVFNSRGAVFRGEGGDQERELAEKYDQWAEKIIQQWPRTAATLRGIASQYRFEARSHDEDARRSRLGLDR